MEEQSTKNRKYTYTLQKSHQDTGILFDVNIDESLSEICKEYNLDNLKNINDKEKYFLLSLMNDFEDKKWRMSRFQDYLLNKLPQAALSLKELEKIYYDPHSKMKDAVNNLKTYSKKKNEYGNIIKPNDYFSEIGEILLYGIMQDYYSALTLVPKIFYKQNTNDYAKGVDSFHITVDNDNTDVWFGEAKFYKDIDDAFDKVITSLKENLDNDKIRTEHRLAYHHTDLQMFKNKISPKAYEKLIKILNQDTSLDYLKPILHVPILLLYECNITKETEELTEEYKNKIIENHIKKTEKYFRNHASSFFNHAFENIKIHLILFPIPSKEEVQNSFEEEVKIYKIKPC